MTNEAAGFVREEGPMVVAGKGEGQPGQGPKPRKAELGGSNNSPPPSVPHSKFYLADFSKQERLKLRC
jgi:hypothetical protein